MKKIHSIVLAFVSLLVIAPMNATAQTLPDDGLIFAPVIKDENGLYCSVTPSYDYANQQGSLKIETFVKGEIKWEVKMPPLDVLFAVAGHSNMGANWNNSSIIAVISDIVGGSGGFLDQLNSQSEKQEEPADIRYGLISFGSNMANSYSSGGWTTQSAVADKLASMAVNNNEVSCASSDPGNGMDAAIEFMNTYRTAQDEADGRQAVVIFITDGEGATQSSLVEQAYQLKKDNVIVASALVNYSKGGHSTTDSDDTYMKYASSDYPDATSASNHGDPITPLTYYNRVSSSAELANFFTALASSIQTGGASVKLSSASYIKDVPGPSYVIPTIAGKQSVSVQTANLNRIEGGVYIFDDPVDATIVEDPNAEGIHVLSEDGSVKVTGFDYTANFCGPVTDEHDVTTYTGAKLITTINFSLVSAASPSVVMFGEGSGFYDQDGTYLLDFPVTTIPIGYIIIKETGLQAGESALFSLYKKGSDVDTLIADNIVLTGKGSGETNAVSTPIILPSLEPGATYYIKSKSDWSWKYGSVTTPAAAAILDGGTTFTFTFDNYQNPPKTAESGAFNEL